MPWKKGQSGNPKGRTEGSKTKKTREWETLCEAITGHQAGKFMKYLDTLWESKDAKDLEKAANLFLQTLEYFKPKQQRITGDIEIRKERPLFGPIQSNGIAKKEELNEN